MTTVVTCIKKRPLSVFLFLIAMFPAALLANETGEKTVVMSMGSGAIIQNDTSRAKELAISDGLVAAVDKTITEILPVEMLVANFETVNATLYDHTKNFIEDYKVITEAKHGKTYRVVLETTVSVPLIREKLSENGILLDEKNSPRILFLVEETIPESAVPLKWWQPGMSFVKTISDDALTLHMKNKGFEVTDHRAVYLDDEAPGNETDGDSETLTKEEAIRIARSFEADFVVVGNATAARLSNSMGEEKSFSGTLSVTCLRTDTGETVISSRQSAVAVNPDEMAGSSRAVAEASALVARELSPAILASLKEAEKSPSMIELVVEGGNFFANFARLSRELKTTDGVERIRPREKRVDRAVLIVNYRGTGKALAESLLARNFDSFGLNISEVSQNHLKLAFVAPKKK